MEEVRLLRAATMKKRLFANIVHYLVALLLKQLLLSEKKRAQDGEMHAVAKHNVLSRTFCLFADSNLPTPTPLRIVAKWTHSRGSREIRLQSRRVCFLESTGLEAVPRHHGAIVFGYAEGWDHECSSSGLHDGAIVTYRRQAP
jgi:hypothetical protein